jgi:hypothetical protein
MASRLARSCVILPFRSFVLSALLSTNVFAQVRASERGSVTQTVDGTNISIEYSRPVARGRAALFGGLVKWDQVWTPGANWATTIEVDRDIRLNGEAVPKGKYTMWMIPREHEDWTLFLSSKDRLFHTQKPDPADASVTIRVKPEPTSHVEVLTWSFPMISSEGAELRLQWGTTAVPVQVSVTSAGVAAAARTELRSYTGTYHLRFEAQEGGSPFEQDLHVFEMDGHLRASMSVPTPDRDPEFDLRADGEHSFRAVYYRSRQVFEQDQETLVVFIVTNGVADRVEFRFGDRVYARGSRLK